MTDAPETVFLLYENGLFLGAFSDREAADRLLYDRWTSKAGGARALEVHEYKREQMLTAASRPEKHVYANRRV